MVLFGGEGGGRGGRPHSFIWQLHVEIIFLELDFGSLFKLRMEASTEKSGLKQAFECVIDDSFYCFKQFQDKLENI